MADYPHWPIIIANGKKKSQQITYTGGYQCFILKMMAIHGHILLLRAIVQRRVDLLKESWDEFKKIDVSGFTGASNSFEMGKFSSTEAFVNWKLVTVVPDIPGLFLSPSRIGWHACH